MNARVTAIYRYGTHCVLPLFACGLVTAAVASFMQSNRGLIVGQTISVAALVIWGFAGGMAMASAAIETIRESGIRKLVKSFASAPAVAIIVILEMMLYWMFVLGGLWLILKMTGFFK